MINNPYTQQHYSNESKQLISSIRQIKDKFKRNQYFRTVASRPAQTADEYQEKIRAMQVAFDCLVEQNREINRQQSNYNSLLKDKDKMLELKQLEIKKYRGQLVEALNKNEQLVNYSRQLAIEYNTILNSMKESDETAFERQTAHNSRLACMQNQVTFLRKKVLGRQDRWEQYEQCKKNKENRNNSKRRKNSQNTGSKNKTKAVSSHKNRKSLASILK